MDPQLILILAVLAFVAYKQGMLGDLSTLATSRNLIILALGAVVAYYVLVAQGGSKTSTEAPAAEEPFTCGYRAPEAFMDAAPVEPPAEQEPPKEVPGNFLDGSSKHQNMFEQQIHASVPYLLGTNIPPPEPTALKRSFLPYDLRPAPQVPIDDTQNIPFGMSSVAAVVATKGGDQMLTNKDVGIAKCL